MREPNEIIGKKMQLPPVVFGTSGLGNLYTVVSEENKREIIKECIRHTKGNLVFDSAGKYGAGLALEVLGKFLKELNVDSERVVISNKLGWLRTKLVTPEPLFELGVWKDLKYDAVQNISYQGILECFEQGNELLNGYLPSMVSVHDPDEFLEKATNETDYKRRYDDILGAYQALGELKEKGLVKAVGVGAKNWKIIEKIAGDVHLDWVMIANSMTIKSHPYELLSFMKKLESEDVQIINSAVFHSGFLIGSDYYDYQLLERDNIEHRNIFQWRDLFFALCSRYEIKPAEACVQFAMKAPGVTSVALNTTNPDRVRQNVNMAFADIPNDFWIEMINNNLISRNYFQHLS